MFGKKVVLPAAGLVLTSVLLPVFAARNGASAPANYSVDSVHSSVVFRIKHMNVSYFWGRFNDVSGTVAWDAENPEASSFDVRIKTESVDSNSKARDNHLKGPDFFNAKQFPVMSFKSSGVKKAGDNTYEVTGELTLHGVTKPLTVKMEMTGEGKGMQGGKVVGFETTFEIKRGEFGMTGGKGALGEDVRVVVSLEAASK